MATLQIVFKRSIKGVYETIASTTIRCRREPVSKNSGYIDMYYNSHKNKYGIVWITQTEGLISNYWDVSINNKKAECVLPYYDKVNVYQI